MLLDKDQKIARPRQIYTGYEERNFVSMDKRTPASVAPAAGSKRETD